MKYNLGTTQIRNSDGDWVYPNSIHVNQNNGTWVPVEKAYVKKEDGTWERVWPIPAGQFYSTTTEITHKYYQNYSDPGYTMTVQNVGDYDLTINSVILNDDIKFTTNTALLPTFPVTLVPGQGTDLRFKVADNEIGVGLGSVDIISHIGYRGYSNVHLTQSVTVLPDYNGIASTGNPNFVSYYLDDTIALNYPSYSNQTFTVAPGIDTLNITLIGGGGGGGGNDSHSGTAGYPGFKLTGKLEVTEGDVIGVYVGGGGGGGVSGRSGAAGGAGGASGVSYGGGAGGRAGYSGSSGGGGGGGGATVLKKNGVVIAVAAGGGGGGGAGDHSHARGQVIVYQLGGLTYGTDGETKSGDGGAGGGGGGGYSGGLGGATVSGDNGAYGGSDGENLVPDGWLVSRAANQGSISVAGGDGSVSILESGLGTSAAQTFTIKNTGNGKDLKIASIASETGRFSISNLSSDTIGFNWDTFTGNTATFVITPVTSTAIGYYEDEIVITSDAIDFPRLRIPLTLKILQANGHKAYTNPGTYQVTIPDHVHRINLLAVAGGGGGGRGLTGQGSMTWDWYNGYVINNGVEVTTWDWYNGYTTNTVAVQGGGGGGGGSGGYKSLSDIKVTPGEVLKVTVGHGGTGVGASSYLPVYEITCGSWSSFMNSYAVWVNANGQDPVGVVQYVTRAWNAPVSGTYTLRLSSDNYCDAFIDNALTTSSSSFTSTTTQTFTVSAGNHTILLKMQNYGGPAGTAATITAPGGAVVWTTRTELLTGSGVAGESTIISGSFGTVVVTGGQGGAPATFEQYYTGWVDAGGGYDGGGLADTGVATGDADSGDGDGGGGGGGGGGKIICTKLYELGLMSRDIYLADQAYGAKLAKTNPDIYNGYRVWAENVVDWMDGKSGDFMKSWATSWAHDIATPWSEHMAYKVGALDKDNVTGRVISSMGLPICKLFGVWQRVFGTSKKPASRAKGLMLIPVFVLFKIVAKLGRLIEGKKL